MCKFAFSKRLSTMIFIILILVALWVYSDLKFRRKYKMDKLLCSMLEQKYREKPSPMTESEYASALMLCQQYQSALDLFEDLKRKGFGRQFSFLHENIKFCKKPLPWSSGAKNHNGSWLHNFLLVRFGGRRMVSISQDTYLEFNAMLRAMERNL